MAMSVVPQPEDPSGPVMLAPELALRSARPIPSAEELEIDGLTDEESTAFENAIAER